MANISIIIVNWNAKGYLYDCLASIQATRGTFVLEIIVVDNASSDGSQDMVVSEYPEVILIRSSTNLGFARANNLGIQQAKGDFVALVNSDVVVHPNCFQHLTTYLEAKPDVGLVGPKVIGRDGNVQSSCGKLPGLWNTMCEFLLLHKCFPRLALFSGFQIRNLDYLRPVEVQVLSGCFCVARRSAIEKVGGLDERFFFYAEDVDWSKRFHDSGWKLVYVPSASATHFGGGSSAKAPLRYSIEMLRANLMYWKKHHGNWGRAVFFVLATVQHGIRLCVRSGMRIARVGNAEACNHKIEEHQVCLRWLFTGRGV